MEEYGGKQQELGAMAIFTVTTQSDAVNPSDGQLSLREAVAQANATAAADTIQFASTLEGRQLVLTQGELVLSQDTTIDGDRNNDGIEVTLSGLGDSLTDGSRIFHLTGGVTDVGLRDLTLTDGSTEGDGGAILLDAGRLTLDGCTIRDCRLEEVLGGDGSTGGAIAAAAGTALTVNGSSIVGNYIDGDGGGGGGISAAGALTIRRTVIADNDLSGEFAGGGGIAFDGSSLLIEDCLIVGNGAGRYGYGGGIFTGGGTASISRTIVADNSGSYSGGIEVSGGNLIVSESTIVDNSASNSYSARGAGLAATYGANLTVRNSTITSNQAFSTYFGALGGGIFISSNSNLDIANSILAGNSVETFEGSTGGPDLFGTITRTNGRNVFGSDVAGNNAGDREGIAASAIFAAIDPETGGGLLGPDGFVPLRNNVANPALAAGDPLVRRPLDETNVGRPLPAGSLADLGAAELNQPLSTAASPNNDTLSGTAAINMISGLAGSDLISGLGGNDTLNGGDGSDLLDGGTGNDTLNGDAAIDLVTYAGATAVVVDLSLATDTAKRGSETDTLTNVEGAIGSSAADTFKGDELDNYFQGGSGKDTYTLNLGRDLVDINSATESSVGAGRDVVTDFLTGTDKIDLAGIDADVTQAGNQSFRWVGAAGLGTAPGALGYFVAGGNRIVRGSVDADASSELEILLTGSGPPGALDFYL